MANNYYARGLQQKAIVYYDSSLTLATQAGYRERQQDLLDNLYAFYSNTGDYKNALQYHVRLEAIKDSMFDENKAFIIDDLRLRYETTQKEIENLKQKNEILRIKKQRNSFIYTVFGIILLAFYIIVYFRTKHRKNKIIAEQKIKQLEEEKKLLAARFLVEGQEKERKRIATAIHDSLGVLLSASKMHVTAIKDKSPETKALIDKATKFLDDASGEMRKISHNMMPGLLTKMGLCEALEDLFENINDTEDIDAKVDVIGPKSERLPENHEIMIYRVVQEMVNNTLKHAQAKKIDLVLVIHPDELDINYSDNGTGFDVEKMIDKKSLGIQSIQSRVSFLDGQVNIQSSPGNGTVYRLHIPVPSKS
jgi:signal transduction histidine kinase